MRPSSGSTSLAPLKSYDLVIIGAGIYGCWSALHATSRGLNVALVDRGDIAGETSSSSTKLLHGGLRYLEQYEFSLVRKSLSERREIKKLLPHLFHPTTFWIPVQEKRPTSPWKLSLGLWAYEHLSNSHGVVPPSRRRKVDELKSSFPSLNFGELDAAFTYGDGVTDDHRMSLVVALEAVERGCDLYTYHSATPKPDGIIELKPENGDSFDISTEKTLHCTGKDLEKNSALKGKLRLTQGSHLVLPDLGQRDALLLNSPLDQRKFFLVPWYGRTLLGTTDLPIDADATPLISNDEVEYLLNSLKGTTGLTVHREDILGSFVGVRTLQGDLNLKPSDVSREWNCQAVGKNSWASIGGKFTSARADALEMIKQIFTSTQAKPLEFRHHDGSSPKNHLHARYGSAMSTITDLITTHPEYGENIFPDLEFRWAELIYSLREEHVTHLVDLMRRRLPLTLLHPWDADVAERALSLASEELGWDDHRKSQEMEALKCHWQGNLNFE